ncbi:hypothetical protein STSO111631_04550 [Stackebrandtia soli]
MYNYGPEPTPGQSGDGMANSPYGPPGSSYPGVPQQPGAYPANQPPGGYPYAPQQQPQGYEQPQPQSYEQPQPQSQPQGYESPAVASAPPASAPPMVAAAPVTGPPPQQPLFVGPAPSRPKSSPAVPILAATTALFFVTAAIFVFLFINKSGELTDAEHKITGLSGEIGDLDEQLTTAEGTIESLEGELAIAQGDAEAKEQLETCLKATYDFLDEAADASDERVEELIDEANTACEDVWHLIS